MARMGKVVFDSESDEGEASWLQLVRETLSDGSEAWEVQVCAVPLSRPIVLQMGNEASAVALYALLKDQCTSVQLVD